MQIPKCFFIVLEVFSKSTTKHTRVIPSNDQGDLSNTIHGWLIG